MRDLPQNFVFRPAVETLGASIPGRYGIPTVAHDDGVVSELDQLALLFLHLERSLALGDVLDHEENQGAGFGVALDWARVKAHRAQTHGRKLMFNLKVSHLGLP